MNQGVKQGGVLSTSLYLVYIADHFHDIKALSLDTGILNIPSNRPFSVDACLLRSSHF